MGVLSSQVSVLNVSLVWGGLLFVALIVWLKRAVAPFAPLFTSPTGIIAMVLALGASYVTVRAASTDFTGEIAWIEFSEAAIDERLARGEIVFVDVTADWCATCKVNEALFINTDAVIGRFKEHKIATFKAD